MENKCQPPFPMARGWGFTGCGIKKQGGSEAWGEMVANAWPRSSASRWRLPYKSGQMCSLSGAQSPDPTPAEPLPCMNTLHPPPCNLGQGPWLRQTDDKRMQTKSQGGTNLILSLSAEIWVLLSPFCLSSFSSHLCMRLTSLSSGQRGGGCSRRAPGPLQEIR